MPKTLYLATNGEQIKNIDLPQYPDEAWDWITGKLQSTKKDELYASVAAVYRVANMTADSIANMPFALYDEREEEYDTSAQWENRVEFMPNPRQLLRLWRLSLFMTNTAYGFMERNRVKIKNIRYIVPTTITPVIDNREGLTGFKRKVGSQELKYTIEEKRILYFHWLDHTTEVKPSDYSEFYALMQAAGVLYYSDYYVNNFFQRGAIDPALLEVAGVPTQEDKERIEGKWDKFVRGWRKFTGMVVQSEGLKYHRIGTGVESLKDTNLHEDKLADIAMAAGMPKSLLISESSNYATAKVEYMTWFRDSVIPKAHFMQDTLNEQLFAPMGLHFKFLPEITNTGTEEEAERAGAFRAYVLSGIPHSIAAQLVGVDMPEGIEYEDLDSRSINPLEVRQSNSGASSDAPLQEDEPDQAQDTTPEKSVSEPTLLTIEQLRELELWQSFAFRKLKRGESLDFPFVCKALPETIASDIRDRLPKCRTQQEIEAAFQMSARDEDPIKELAEAINLAVNRMELIDG